MKNKLTFAQIIRLAKVDQAAYFTDEDVEALPGLHFCPDCDFLAVCNSSPEMDCCTCSAGLKALASSGEWALVVANKAQTGARE